MSGDVIVALSVVIGHVVRSAALIADTSSFCVDADRVQFAQDSVALCADSDDRPVTITAEDVFNTAGGMRPGAEIIRLVANKTRAHNTALLLDFLYYTLRSAEKGTTMIYIIECPLSLFYTELK
jgi:hypothetical protein